LSAKSFAAGIVSGALAIGISLLIRSLIGEPFLPELASQTLFSLTPGEFESQAAGFTPEGKENYKIIVRATDKTGQVQTAEFNKPFPDGATGYQSISI